MKKTSTLLILTNLFVIAALLLACGGGGAAAPTPNVDAAVQTAVAGTAAAQTAIAQAVQSTVVAQPAATALPPTATPTAPVDYYTLSEEELAALIDTAVTEALAASDQATTSTTQASSDGAVTDTEVYNTMVYVYAAEAALAYADELIAAYYELYGAYASATLTTLQAMEQDLNAIAASLNEIETIMQQGAAAASAAAAQLQAAASEAAIKASAIQATAQGWVTQVQDQIKTRENQYLSVKPNQIAGTPDEAIIQVHDYLDTVKSALGDRKVNPEEMTKIAQQGANATASLQAHGGANSQNMVNGIDKMTRELARGEWPQANKSVGSFEASVPARPEPSKPEPSKPQPPTRR